MVPSQPKYVIPPKQDESGLRMSNCFYCKKAYRERDMRERVLYKKDKTPGDKLMVCPSCNNDILVNRRK